MRPKFGRRPLTVALATISVLTLGGLATLDRALRRADQAQLEQRATEAKVLVETFLAVRAEALSAFRGLYLTPDESPGRERFVSLVGALASTSTASGACSSPTRAGWCCTRRSSRTRRSPRCRGARRRHARGARHAPRDARGAPHAAARSSRPRAHLHGERGFLIVDPHYVRGRFAGFAVGAVPTLALAARLPRRARAGAAASPARRARHRGARRDARRPPPHAQAPYEVQLPGGGPPWVAEVTHVTMTGSCGSGSGGSACSRSAP
jgi:hypothetical protein